MTESTPAEFAVMLHPGCRQVEAWSTRRLPFEPRGSMLGFRSELRSTLAGLDASSGRLRCNYGSRAAELCDAENVLLYNVGTSTFSRVASKAVMFERSYDFPACPVRLAGPAEHYHLYVADCDVRFLSWRVTVPAASFGGQITRRVDKVADWWWSMRSSIQGVAGSDLTGERFGLRIRLGPSSRAVINLVKPMLDGIVAAFHRDPAPDALAVSRLAAYLATSPEAVKANLNPSYAPLGQRRLLWPYRDGVQWNPADELCVACHVEVDDRLPPRSFKGDLLQVSAQSATPGIS